MKTRFLLTDFEPLVVLLLVPGVLLAILPVEGPPVVPLAAPRGTRDPLLVPGTAGSRRGAVFAARGRGVVGGGRFRPPQRLILSLTTSSEAFPLQDGLHPGVEATLVDSVLKGEQGLP